MTLTGGRLLTVKSSKAKVYCQIWTNGGGFIVWDFNNWYLPQAYEEVSYLSRKTTL